MTNLTTKQKKAKEREMKTKVEPTVEKWESDFDKICFYEEEASMFETPDWTPDKPIMFQRLNAEHLGDVEYKLLPEIKKFIRTLLSNSVQEAKAERDREWIKELQPTGIGNSLYIMPSNHLFSSLKQEEEK